MAARKHIRAAEHFIRSVDHRKSANPTLGEQLEDKYLEHLKRGRRSGHRPPLKPDRQKYSIDRFFRAGFLLDCFPKLSTLKIDLETHEASILRGAERLLREVRPVIWCEVSHKNSDAVTDLLRSAKYELYGAESQPRQRIERAWFQTLALPIPLRYSLGSYFPRKIMPQV